MNSTSKTVKPLVVIIGRCCSQLIRSLLIILDFSSNPNKIMFNICTSCSPDSRNTLAVLFCTTRQFIRKPRTTLSSSSFYAKEMSYPALRSTEVWSSYLAPRMKTPRKAWTVCKRDAFNINEMVATSPNGDARTRSQRARRVNWPWLRMRTSLQG